MVKENQYASEIRSALEAESMKQHATRNMEYETQDNPAMIENPGEESKTQSVP